MKRSGKLLYPIPDNAKMADMIALTRAWVGDRVADEIGAVHRIIISDPARNVLSLGIHWNGDHLHLAFHDVVESGPDRFLATEDQIAALITFSQAWDGHLPLVVNCYAGRSRSPAALSIILATLNPGRERQIVDMIVGEAPHAAPNRHMIALGDRLLGCGGRLINAVKAMPPSTRGFAGTSFFDTRELAKVSN